MSITPDESGQPDSNHSSGGAKEVTDQSTVETALPKLRPVALPMTIMSNNWAVAEEATHDIIQKVRPTSESEERRREVISYIQRLIKKFLGVEVLPYGSVPLRTYLPDGDIDLTAFGGANIEDSLVDDMKYLLEEEEKSTAAEFVIKDVQLIRAEVKLVKCIVQNIVVDVSFNQIGGLCTLCFLEQVDRLIGKDHLFKRSIILIKAWCYYESRILGAHHGLISTYALETLVLYIFHLYHSRLDGPLAVLHKFLDYFSKFDWDMYCISINGPIRVSSLPDIVVEMPEDSDEKLLFSNDFLSYCLEMFSVPSRGGDQNSRGFQRKHLNVVDPLKEFNNLGRSVSKGNFYRVRSAFSYGARKLEQILAQPENFIAKELHKFFSNTLARHACQQKLGNQIFDLSITSNGSMSTVPVSETGACKTFKSTYEDRDEYTLPSRDLQSSSGKLSEVSIKEIEISNIAHGEQDDSLVLTRSELHDAQPPKQISPNRGFNGDTSDLAVSGLVDLKISTDLSRSQTPIKTESSNSYIKPPFAPHEFFANSRSRNGCKMDENLDSDELDKCKSQEKRHVVEKNDGLASKQRDAHLASSSPPSSRNADHELGSASRSETPESLNLFIDLTGDYDSYFQYLQYGRWCCEYALGLHPLHVPAQIAPYQNNNPWDGVLPPSQFKRNGFPNQHQNGFHPGPAVYPMPHVLIPGVPFGWEEMPKPRGTGTYFPNMIQSPQGYRSSTITGRNKVSPRSPFNKGRNMIFLDPNMPDRISHETAQSHVPGDKNVMISSFDGYQTSSPRGDGYPQANGFIIQPEGVVDVGLVAPASGTTIPEKSKSSQNPISSSPRTLSGTEKSQSAFSRERDR